MNRKRGRRVSIKDQLTVWTKNQLRHYSQSIAPTCYDLSTSNHPPTPWPRPTPWPTGNGSLITHLIQEDHNLDFLLSLLLLALPSPVIWSAANNRPCSRGSKMLFLLCLSYTPDWRYCLSRLGGGPLIISHVIDPPFFPWKLLMLLFCAACSDNVSVLPLTISHISLLRSSTPYRGNRGMDGFRIDDNWEA